MPESICYAVLQKEDLWQVGEILIPLMRGIDIPRVAI